MRSKIISHSKVITTIFIFLLSLNSCSDNPTNNDVTYNLINSLSGTITGLPSDSRIIKAVVSNPQLDYMIASDTIGSDSAMNINLTIPPAGSLIDISDFLIQNSVTSLNISDYYARVNVLQMNAYDTANILSGSLSKLNYNPNDSAAPFRISVSAFYCDRPLNISGTNKMITGSDTIVVIYGAAFGTGWNVTTLRTRVVRTHYIEYEYFNGEALGAKWYFDS